MTEQHPITPPPELVEKWFNDSPLDRGLTLATRAAQWGADQELEACCADIHTVHGSTVANWLRAMRRPKPPSLKEEALKALKALDHRVTEVAWTHTDTIRRALEALDD
jgi:cell division inhibitor SulA